MDLEEKLMERGLKPDTCEARDEKLVCETEEGEEIEITKEDVKEMMGEEL